MADREVPPLEPVAVLFRAKAEWHRQQASLPVKEKVRILLELQRQDYPLLKRHRPLEWWEEPWAIERSHSR
jgi:hypothetical protein